MTEKPAAEKPAAEKPKAEEPPKPDPIKPPPAKAEPAPSAPLSKEESERVYDMATQIVLAASVNPNSMRRAQVPTGSPAQSLADNAAELAYRTVTAASAAIKRGVK